MNEISQFIRQVKHLFNSVLQSVQQTAASVLGPLMQRKNFLPFVFVFYIFYFVLLWVFKKVCLQKCITEFKRPAAAVPYLCRQVATHSTVMGVQGHSGGQARPVVGDLLNRSSGGIPRPGSGACWSWGFHRWGFLGGCRARRSQLEWKTRKCSY